MILLKAVAVAVLILTGAGPAGTAQRPPIWLCPLGYHRVVHGTRQLCVRDRQRPSPAWAPSPAGRR